MEKEKKKMGRPTDNPRNIRIEIRMNEEESQDLKECTEKLNLTKTDVIVKGIQLVKKELEKQ